MKNWKPDLRDGITFGGLVMAAAGTHYAVWSLAVLGVGFFVIGLRVN